MKKKLLVSLSSIGLAAGFWACGSGTVEPLNEETDGYVRAMLETGSIDFATQITDAKKKCNDDIVCMNEMAKANDGAIMIESSATPEPESSDGTAPKVSSSSRDIFTPTSSIGPIGQQSSSSSATIPVQQSSSSEALPPGTLGTCAPAAATAELNGTVTWGFEWAEPKPAANVMLSATFAWEFEGGSPAVGEKRTATTSYATSGTKTASVTVNAGGTTQTATCTVNVNGAPITNCTCLPTNIQPDVNAGESATWTASGCKTSANITGYTWTGATADATGLTATAPVSAKGDVVSGVSFTVSNDDNTKVTIKCDDAKAIDMSIPDYIIDGTAEGTYTGVGPGDYTMVYACKTDQYYQTPLMVVAPDGAVTGSVNGTPFSVSQYGQEKVFSSQTPNTSIAVKITSGSATIKCQ